MADHYQTEQEIEAVVAGFENCTTSKDKFTHSSHLTVAAYYLCTSTPVETLEKMRFGLLRFLDHHRVGRAQYSDLVTWAWIKQIQNVIQQMDDESSLVAVTNAVLEQLGHYRLTLEGQREHGTIGS
ncbi:MAG: hypothetical protein ACREA9_15925 [Pyrinomonadaceae bacterium]